MMEKAKTAWSIFAQAAALCLIGLLIWYVLQIADRIAFGQQQPSRRARIGGPCGNQRLGQIKIEIGQLHPPFPVATGGGRRKMSRNMPGVKIDSGLTEIAGASAVPVRL